MVHGANRLPFTWGVAVADVDFFWDEMVQRCPELLLCEDDWKANYLATQIHSSWKRTHGTGTIKKRVKEETQELTLADNKDIGPSKRKISNTLTNGGVAKKPRPGIVDSVVEAQGRSDGDSKTHTTA